MKELSYVINDELGLHARPAGNLVKLAGSFASEISIANGEKSANAKKIMSVMKLAAGHGAKLKLSIEGADEAEAFDAISKFLTENL